MRTKYVHTGSQWSPVDVSVLDEVLVDALPVGIYRVVKGAGFGFLDIGKQFEFSHPLYGLETEFIDIVTKTYAESEGNLGILLNGKKGGGKSVTAKLLANKLGLPVLLVESNYGEDLARLLASLQQDVLVLVDEYEKIYSHTAELDEDGDKTGNKIGDASLLSVMDGTTSTNFRRVFLLTTNKLFINENMLQRPGRIMFLHEFGNLSRTVIEEIIDARLKPELREALREDTVVFIAGLEEITVDIVTSMVNMVNIHQKPLDELYQYLNVKKLIPKHDIYYVKPTGEVRVKWDAEGIHEEHLTTGNYLHINGSIIGMVEDSYDPLTDTVKIRLTHNGHARLDFQDKKLKDNDVVTLRLQKVKSWHSSYGGVYA